MSKACEPKRIISTSVLARRLEISRPVLDKHLRRGIINADYKSDGGTFFDPDNLPALRKKIADHRGARTWRYLASAIFSQPTPN